MLVHVGGHDQLFSCHFVTVQVTLCNIIGGPAHVDISLPTTLNWQLATAVRLCTAIATTTTKTFASKPRWIHGCKRCCRLTLVQLVHVFVQKDDQPCGPQLEMQAAYSYHRIYNSILTRPALLLQPPICFNPARSCCLTGRTSLPIASLTYHALCLPSRLDTPGAMLELLKSTHT